MANWEFNIQEILALNCLKVNVPPFLNQSGLVNGQEMLSTQRIARSYLILDLFPTTLCKSGLIDMIFFVCALFTNFLLPLLK